jgi:hypothetical protein
MTLLSRHIERLASDDRWTYRASSASGAEPASWAALALAAHGEVAAASRAAAWLAEVQQTNGAVGVSAADRTPCWPTSLAMLAWSAFQRAVESSPFDRHIDRAAQWSLDSQGKTGDPSPLIGHDTTLVGWSWAENTASWLEPSCYFVLGLTAAGYGDHPRVKEGAQLIADRLLPSGGANYGNTIVMGQELLAHVAPTGVAMLTLAGRGHADVRVERSLDYLERHAGPGTAPASLSWACIGLAAHARRPIEADEWIVSALADDAWQPLAAYERSLLLLAARATIDWLPGVSTVQAPLPGGAAVHHSAMVRGE